MGVAFRPTNSETTPCQSTLCKRDEACNGGGSCQCPSGTCNIDCDSNIPVCARKASPVCNEFVGACEYEFDPAATCSDNNACTDNDHCAAGPGGTPYCTGTLRVCNTEQNDLRCQALSSQCIKGLTPCFRLDPLGSCNSRTGLCNTKLVTFGSCEDGDGCTSGEVCSADGTCGGGTTTSCVQTTDQCYGSVGTCVGSSGSCPLGDKCDVFATHKCSYARKAPGTACSLPSDKCLLNTHCNVFPPDQAFKCYGTPKDCGGSGCDVCEPGCSSSTACNPVNGQCYAGGWANAFVSQFTNEVKSLSSSAACPAADATCGANNYL